MKEKHGFTLEKEAAIQEIGGTARLYRHKRTGARLLSVENRDENKVFGVAFRTPPADSTGIAHILEHSVLCGSDKYPVKEPFVELLKGSLQTFLNAFTYPDKTCYPVASQNLQDFYNLIGVYFDAVFHPLITEEIFMQEGWHYELETAAGPLTRKGVVYNEMKGAYSSPEGLLMEHSQRSLFPDTAYGLDSGGDPEVIPDLTYPQFQEFHSRLYHPSNAWIWFAGDDDPDERLRLADEALQPFERLNPDTEVALQRPLPATQPLLVPFDAGEGGRTTGMFTRNWLLPETTETETVFAFVILEQALLGNAAAPLRRALIESGLGEDLAGVGLEDELRQMYFSTGLKGVEPENFETASRLINGTLTALAEEGIPEDILAAACNTVLFRLRENNTGRFPRGLSLMLRSLRTWLYDGDPFALLAFEEPLSRVIARIKGDPGYLSGLIRTHLLDNPHQSEVRLLPDEKLGQERETAEMQQLATILTNMDEKTRQDIIEETANLLRLQQTADAPEALATIPRLTVADLPREGRTIPSAATPVDSAELLTHPQDTAGITYLDLSFPLDHLEGELLPWIPIFGRALIGMGTEQSGYSELTTRIGTATGGIRRSVWGSPSEGGGAVQRLVFRTKALVEQEEEMVCLLAEILQQATLTNKERFLQLVLEAKAHAEHALVPSGHQVVLKRLQARLHPAHALEESFHGVSQLLFLRELETRVKEDWAGVQQTLTHLQQQIICRQGATAGITAGDADLPAARKRVEGLLLALPHGQASAAINRPVLQAPAPELLTIPARVNYAGLAANLYDAGYTFHGSALVASRFLRTSYLWERVRVQGGAYGAFAPFNRQSGVMAFVSYRDPNCAATLEAFRGSARFLSESTFSKDDMEKAILGTIGDMDAHLLPDAKGLASLRRHLSGTTDDLRQRIRDEVLATTAEDFKAFGQAMETAFAQGLVTVLGDAAKREELPEGTVVTGLL